MKDEDRTKDELMNELAKLRQPIAKLETLQSERNKAEEALRREKDRAERYLNIAGVMLAIVNADEKITMINKKGCEILGYKEKELIGKNWFDFLVPQRIRDEVKEVFHKLMAGDIRPVEYHENPLLTKDKGERLIAFHSSPIRDSNGKITGVLFSAEDITQRRKQEKQLTYMVMHDTLTGLASRALFSDHLSLALAHAQRNRQRFPVMLLDLDNFKDVNDRLGHSVGDKLLEAAGNRLKGILRKADTVARMGGDEFLLLLPETTRTEDVAVVAQKILTAFQKPFLVDGHQINTTTSIGIAIYPADGRNADTLIKNADNAMYRVKEQGRNNYQYHTTIMEE